MKVYALVDLKGRDIVSIFQSVSDEAASRSFLKLLTDGMPVISDFPEDFAVFYVGDLSVHQGSLDVCFKTDELGSLGYNVPEPIKRGSDYDRRFLRMVAEDRGTTVDNKVVKDSEKTVDKEVSSND